MSRLLFEDKRRLPIPNSSKTTITIAAPPELPRPTQKSLLAKSLPTLIALLVVAVVVATIATGMHIITPQTLIYPFMMLMAATGIYQGTTPHSITTAEIDEERADYLRYLSQIRNKILNCEEQQRASLEWSHLDPDNLGTILGLRRQWERDYSDSDFLQIRIGKHDVISNTILKVHDIENDLDLEPVCHTAVNHLLSTHKLLIDAPFCLSLTSLPYIRLYWDSNADNDNGACTNKQHIYQALRAWIGQCVIWHDPAILALAIASTDIESEELNWTKWLPHTDIRGKEDGVGPARYLTNSSEHLAFLLYPLLSELPNFAINNIQPYKHTIIILDTPDANITSFIPDEGLQGVTIIHITDKKPDIEQIFDPTKPILTFKEEKIFRWQNDQWKIFVNHADTLSIAETRHIARSLARWGYETLSRNTQSSAALGANFTSLLGIEDASHLDIPVLWARRSRDEELRVPIGTTSNGDPLYFDLKNEAEGGMGPHGLMIGMTGSGKSQTIMSILLSLLTTHPANRLIVIYADFTGAAGVDIFRDFPQVVAIISNMSEKRSLAERFADTLRGEVARRENLLLEYGRQIQGSAFSSVYEYEQAIENGHDLPDIPTLFIIADEFSLMLEQYPEYAELFDYIARKGRSYRIHILFTSQTLDIGKIKDIDKNTSYRIALKVASPSISRQVIGVEDAYHIESGREHKGEGFLIPAPGALPIKFRSTYVDGIYEPAIKNSEFIIRTQIEPKLFTACYVEPPENIVIYEQEEYTENTIQPVQKLITTIGNQLKNYGPKAPQLWLSPLDEPITLDSIDFPKQPHNTHSSHNELSWILGEIDRPFEMCRNPLIFDATSAAGNMIIHGGSKSGKSTALQTFILSAAARYSPIDIQFYCLDYGGGTLRSLENLAHIGGVASGFEEEKVRRTFCELEQLIQARQLLFRDNRISSINQFRSERKNNPLLDDGFGEVFLIIDNYYAFSRDKTDQFHSRNPLSPRLAELINNGLPYGIHVIITTPNWSEIPLNIRNSLGLRLELKLHDPQDSNVQFLGALRKPAESVPADQPGRGLTMHAEHFLFALPRYDGIPSSDDLPQAMHNTITEINELFPGLTAHKVRLLSNNLRPTDLPFIYKKPEHIAIGEYENDLSPVIHNFTKYPFMILFGDSRSGKTSLLRYIIRTLRDNSSEKSIAFTVIDRRLHLIDEILFPDNEYTANLDRITPAMFELYHLLEKRRPPTNLTQKELKSWRFTGKKHYLIIDDLDQIPDSADLSGPYAGYKPWSELIKLLGQASDIGLRVIVTARASSAGHSIMTNQLLRKLNDLQATIIMLSGNPQDSQKIRNQKFQRLITGRGILLTDSENPTFIQLVNPLYDSNITSSSY